MNASRCVAPLRRFRPSSSEVIALLCIVLFAAATAASAWAVTDQNIELDAFHRAPKCGSPGADPDDCVSYETMRVTDSTNNASGEDDDGPVSYYLDLRGAHDALIHLEVREFVGVAAKIGTTVMVKFWRDQPVMVTTEFAHCGTQYHPGYNGWYFRFGLVISIVLLIVSVNVYGFARSKRLRKDNPGLPWISTGRRPSRFCSWNVTESAERIILSGRGWSQWEQRAFKKPDTSVWHNGSDFGFVKRIVIKEHQDWEHGGEFRLLVVTDRNSVQLGRADLDDLEALRPFGEHLAAFLDRPFVMIRAGQDEWASPILRPERFCSWDVAEDDERILLTRQGQLQGETLEFRKADAGLTSSGLRLGWIEKLVIREWRTDDHEGKFRFTAIADGTETLIASVGLNEIEVLRPFANHLAAFLERPLEFVSARKLLGGDYDQCTRG